MEETHKKKERKGFERGISSRRQEKGPQQGKDSQWKIWKRIEFAHLALMTELDSIPIFLKQKQDHL